MKISVSEYPREYNNISSYFATIEIGDYSQTMLVRSDFWTLDSYKRQWREGIERIKHKDVSCLVLSVQHPEKVPLINWWPLYKDGDMVIIQNHLLVGDYYQKDIGNNLFLLDNCYNFIPAYQNYVDGEEVSEWRVKLEDFKF